MLQSTMPILPGAHDFVVNVEGDLYDGISTFKPGSGLKILLSASYPEASHDSSCHPLSCFPGTRVRYIEDIVGWGLTPATKRDTQMLWMEGPAGVGKSSVAQSCAEKVGRKLAAAFFFSRPNGRDISTQLFPSIAYQLTTKFRLYRDILDKKIFYDPSLVNKSIDIQLRELIVVPFQELKNEGKPVRAGIVFIDGLDECAGEDAQCNIIDVISASVRERTTPFSWCFFSRPEPHIVAQFDAPHIHEFCWKLTLPVSHDADGDVELYLRDGFRKIRSKYGIPSTAHWPSQPDLLELVRRSKGLFVYPTSVIGFVGEGGPLGPGDQLRLVLQLRGESTSNPWSHLDAFYTLIMRGIPSDMLENALKLLSIAYVHVYGQYYKDSAAILGLSLPNYCAALSKLHSVAKLTYNTDGYPLELKFYHASFTDFLGNRERSGRFCVKKPGTCAGLLADVIRFLNKGSSSRFTDDLAVQVFWKMGLYAALDTNILQQLSQCDYRSMPAVYRSIKRTDAKRFLKNIPPEWQKKIMRPYSPSPWRIFFGSKKPSGIVFILGRGNKKCGLLPLDSETYKFCNLPARGSLKPPLDS